MSQPESSRSTVSLVLLSAAWAMGGFLLASTLIEPLLAFRESEEAATLRQTPVGREHAAEAASMVMIREAIAAFYENAGRYPKNLDELVTGRWLGAARLHAPGRVGQPYFAATAQGYTLLPWRQ
jgi:hypothetical protein